MQREGTPEQEAVIKRMVEAGPTSREFLELGREHLSMLLDSELTEWIDRKSKEFGYAPAKCK